MLVDMTGAVTVPMSPLPPTSLKPIGEDALDLRRQGLTTDASNNESTLEKGSSGKLKKKKGLRRFMRKKRATRKTKSTDGDGIDGIVKSPLADSGCSLKAEDEGAESKREPPEPS